MDLFDLLERACDWVAAARRTADAGKGVSVEINARRFGIEFQLAAILERTIRRLEGPPA
jgi:hypothetical protein